MDRLITDAFKIANSDKLLPIDDSIVSVVDEAQCPRRGIACDLQHRL